MEEWSLVTFTERTGRAIERRFSTAASFVRAADASLARCETEWFVSARLPSGLVLDMTFVQGLIDAGQSADHPPWK